jgi:peptidoglycan-N-acetylglucosamine deacetylase
MNADTKEYPEKNILITIDIEDWFQVENLKNAISFSTWDSCELRVEQNVHKLLDLLDSMELSSGSQSTVCNGKHNQPVASSCQQNYSSNAINSINSINPSNTSNTINPRNPKATFFVLGWLAERLPHLVREIHSRGHEVASHGYSHNLCYDCGNNELREDLSISKKLLEDIIGAPVYGYRAPSFSINNDVLKVIEDCGYLYDSSYNSFGLHGRYGRLDLSDFQKHGIALKISNTFYEIPISNLNFSIVNFILPWGGGGYFRLIPFSIFNMGINWILDKEMTYVFYFHPWEIDPGQPKVSGSSWLSRFKHYTNLNKTSSRFSRLLKKSDIASFPSCKTYLDQLRQNANHD